VGGGTSEVPSLIFLDSSNAYKVYLTKTYYFWSELNPFIMYLSRTILCYCLFLLVFSACNRKILVIEASTEDCMIPESSYEYDSLVAVSAQKFAFDTANCSTEIKKRYTNRSISIAKDMQIMPLLCEYNRLALLAPHDPAAVSMLKTEIQQRVLVAITDLNSLQAEITCERERIQEVYDHISGWVNNRINKATVYSILAGGVTTVIASSIALKGNEDVPRFEQGFTVLGAVAGAYYSFRSLAIHKKIKLLHDRNHLADIWNKKSQSRIYSPYIWGYISKTFYIDGKPTTGIEEVLKKWKALELIGEPTDKQYTQKVNLLFGMGGDYTQADLENRQKMYEILMDEIITINYDLNRLMEEIILNTKH
jgi:hypothetical protein